MRKNAKMNIGIVLLALIVFIAILYGIFSDIPNPINTGCECQAAGCSNELCVEKSKASDIVSTCIYSPEYDCLKYSTCGCVNGKCQWEENQNYTTCLRNVRGDMK